MPRQNLILLECLNFSCFEPLLAFSEYFPLSIYPHSPAYYSPFHLLLNSLRILALTKIENFVYAFIQKNDFLSHTVTLCRK